VNSSSSLSRIEINDPPITLDSTFVYFLFLFLIFI